jgi:hypothetical protein
MNANELADELDKSREESYTSEHLVGKAATMLRQQQAEIEALKAKTLTHDEIAEIYHSENRFSPQGNFLYYGFARAILRKVSEK